MFDNNWELINGPIAHHIEFLNARNQSNVLESLILFLLAHRGPLNNGAPPMPDAASLCALHNAGTLFLLAQPGAYRNIEVFIGNQNGDVAHQPMPWQNVPGAVEHFFRELSSVWSSGDALDVAAYALWRINWIHPFRNGNGRSARAFCYACLSLKLGVLLPGEFTVIDYIMKNRDRYESALQTAHDCITRGEIADLRPMKDFLNDAIQAQMASIPEPDAADPSDTTP